jgi:putative YhbY family RNA-binding protein
MFMHPGLAGLGTRHCLKYLFKEILVPLQLSPVERRALKARAHALEPTVLVGGSGLTPAVTGEIDRSLNAHDLIKVRVMGDDREVRDDILKRICEDLNAAPVQHIGKILVIYRPKPEAPSKPRPKAKRKPPRALKRSFQNRA